MENENWISRYNEFGNNNVTFDNATSPENVGNTVLTIINQSFENLELINTKITECHNKAEEVYSYAKEASAIEPGTWGCLKSWFGGRGGDTDTIEALQQVAMSQSTAIISLCENQKLLFEQQQLLANCTKHLYLLCCSNIVCAEIAVKAITERLSGAQGNTLSTVAKEEMFKLVEQLKNQVNIYNRFENFKRDTQDTIRKSQYRIEHLEDKIIQLGKKSEDLEKRSEDLEKRKSLGCSGVLLILLILCQLLIWWYFIAK